MWSCYGFCWRVISAVSEFVNWCGCCLLFFLLVLLFNAFVVVAENLKLFNALVAVAAVVGVTI